ncbi:hypothetical protein EC973_000287 [Apophysomyces ossiformis]|uniref:Nucleoporin Nup159/Nup146 N-terminal domain-containing protein n=1 Tax=Apophysomyces ossiformis TaxID=679940 RepID=A0A8H7BNN2_9FUNG|nr:hypothetical protein EC973_000287 [Apophysomyces ossiformis]
MSRFDAIADLEDDNEQEYELDYGPEPEDVEFFRFNGLVPDAKVALQDSPFESSQYPSEVSLLACSSKYGYFVAGSVDGFIFGRTKALRSAFYGAGKGETVSLSDKTHVRVEQGPVCQLRLSADELQIIVAAADGSLLIFNAQDIAKNKQNCKPVRTFQLGSRILDLRPNPQALPHLAALRLEGDVCTIFDLTTGEKDATISNDVTAVCWSPKGKQLVCGTRAGSLHQYDVAGEEKIKIDAPEEMCAGFGEEEGTRYVQDVLWVETRIFLAIYTRPRKSNDDDHVNDAYIIETPQAGKVTYSRMGEVTPVFTPEGRDGHFYMETITNFGEKVKYAIILANAATSEVSVVGQGEDGRWATWRLEENALANLPLSEKTYMDTLPLGIALDYSASEPLPPYDPSESDTGVNPVPVFYYINDEGIIGAHHCYSVELAKNGEKYNGMIEAQELDVEQEAESLQFNLSISEKEEAVPVDSTTAVVTEQEMEPSDSEVAVPSQEETSPTLPITSDTSKEIKPSDAELIVTPQQRTQPSLFSPPQHDQQKTSMFAASPFGAAIKQQDDDAFSNLLSGVQTSSAETATHGFNVTGTNKLPSFSSLGSAPKVPSIGFGFGSAPSFGGFGAATTTTQMAPLKATSTAKPTFGSTSTLGAATSTPTMKTPTFGSTSLFKSASLSSETKTESMVTQTVSAPTAKPLLAAPEETKPPASKASAPESMTLPAAKTTAAPTPSFGFGSATGSTQTTSVSKPLAFGAALSGSAAQPMPQPTFSTKPVFGATSALGSATSASTAMKPPMFGSFTSKPLTETPSVTKPVTITPQAGLEARLPKPQVKELPEIGALSVDKSSPIATPPVVPKPAVSEPVKLEPVVSKPAVSEPVESKPVTEKEPEKPKPREMTAEETLAHEFETAYFDTVDAMKMVEKQHQEVADILKRQTVSLPVAKTRKDLENEGSWNISDAQALTQITANLKSETEQLQSKNNEFEESLRHVGDKVLKLHVRESEIEKLVQLYSDSESPEKVDLKSFEDDDQQLPLDIEVQDLWDSLQALSSSCASTLNDLESKLDDLNIQEKQRKALLGKGLSLYSLRRIMRDVERDVRKKDIEVKDLEEQLGRLRLMEYQDKARKAGNRITVEDLSDEEEEEEPDTACSGIQGTDEPFSNATLQTATSFLRREIFLDNLQSVADKRKPRILKA